MNAEQAWQATLGQLQMDMQKAAFDTWVKGAKLAGFDNGIVRIEVLNPYVRDWLETRLHERVSRMLTGILNQPVRVQFVLTSKEEDVASETIVSQDSDVIDQVNSTPPARIWETLSRRINQRYSFNSFIVGTGNRLAHAASLAVAEHPAKSYNPLFLYGGVGMGKTHLLHAITRYCLEHDLKALYVSSEEFTNDLIGAIRQHTTPAFREKYREADVLLIDDIQFIAGKEYTQEEFFHTFNHLHGQNKQIVVSSDRPPKALVTLEERLRSRFEWGLIADIQAPDLETRIAILRSKAESMGRKIPADILEMLAKRILSNVRELEGALNRILAFSDLSGLPLTQALVNTALVDIMPVYEEADPTQIIQRVSEVFRVSKERLLGRDRSASVVLPRQLAMYLLRENTKLSLPQIGAELGGRDHTTVMYACEKMNNRLIKDEALQRQVARIRELAPI